MREVEVFLTVADELHFGRAAERLHRTTSYVSQIIRLLERRVGGALFERTSRRVTLTPLGERFLADLTPGYQAMQAALATAQRRTREPAGQQTLRAAATTTVPSDQLEEVTRAFGRSRAGVRLVWHTLPFAQYFQWFSDRDPPGGIDVVLAWVPSTSGDVLPRSRLLAGPVIKRAPRVLLMAEDQPLAGRSSVDIEDLAEHDVLSPVTANPPFADAWCPPVTPSGRPIRRIQMESVFPEQLGVMLADGVLHITGAAWAARVISYPGTVTVPLTGLPPLLLVSTWLAARDSDLIRSFAEAAAHHTA